MQRAKPAIEAALIQPAQAAVLWMTPILAARCYDKDYHLFSFLPIPTTTE
jgi:hypothetical protein